MTQRNVIHTGDALEVLRTLPDCSVNCVVTSPPYFGLRDYGMDGQLGLEPTPAAYVTAMVAVFAEVRRVLTDDGTCWVNIGDSYASGEVGRHDSVQGREIDGKPVTVKSGGIRQQTKLDTQLPPKSLIGIPWRVAFGLQDDGWILRSDIIWSKPNPMPESVTDRPTKAHEYVFLLTKSPRYWYDAEAIQERTMQPVGVPRLTKQHKRGTLQNLDSSQLGANQGAEHRNARTVWQISTEPTPFAHFATMPTKLVRRCIVAGCPVGGVVLDPFFGSGTTGLVARKEGRDYIGIELNPEYVALAERRLAQPYTLPMLFDAVDAEAGREAAR